MQRDENKLTDEERYKKGVEVLRTLGLNNEQSNTTVSSGQD
jgi:hypothetical protein